MDQWETHRVESVWKPWVDFKIGQKNVRVVSVAVFDSGKQPVFGRRLVGYVSNKDYDRGHDVYVLCAWYAPWVDIVGWIASGDLSGYSSGWKYRIEESFVKPMEDWQSLERNRRV